MVEKLLRQYGMAVTICQEGADETVRGFFQPVTGKVEHLAAAHPGMLGTENTRRYVYIGPLEPRPAEQGILRIEGKEYRVRTVQEIWGANGPVYLWGMCVEKGGDDQWGMSGSSGS